MTDRHTAVPYHSMGALSLHMYITANTRKQRGKILLPHIVHIIIFVVLLALSETEKAVCDETVYFSFVTFLWECVVFVCGVCVLCVHACVRA